MNKKKTRFSADTIVSFSAIVIASASIFVAIWQGIENRKHNRLSVRPKLQIMFSVDKEKFGYKIVNNGLGPATITGKRIFIDDKEISYEGFSGYEELINKLNFNDRHLSHSAINPGITITAGETRNIILVNIEEEDNLDTLLPAIYQRIRIEITYESMYNESFITKLPG